MIFCTHQTSPRFVGQAGPLTSGRRQKLKAPPCLTGLMTPWEGMTSNTRPTPGQQARSLGPPGSPNLGKTTWLNYNDWNQSKSHVNKNETLKLKHGAFIFWRPSLAPKPPNSTQIADYPTEITGNWRKNNCVIVFSSRFIARFIYTAYIYIYIYIVGFSVYCIYHFIFFFIYSSEVLI